MFYEDLTMNSTILFPFLSTNTGNEKQSNDNWFFIILFHLCKYIKNYYLYKIYNVNLC